MTNSTQLISRPPVVVVMGHVDHGKSTLLDYIRKANTVAKEFGGITQHVAAYEAEHVYEGEAKRITFIDTPGHAAFGAIRARGANVANIAILVVAADDGVKAQTLEALEAIRAAKIPFIVAINKIDKPNANITRTQSMLLEHGVYLEQLGGDVPWIAISAKTGAGVPELLDLILLIADLQELVGDQSKPAFGYVIEANRDPRRGIAATLLITDGTLKIGEAVLAGGAISPVRIMENHLGNALKSATFSTPVTLTGFDELPKVGESFLSYKNKREAEAARASDAESWQGQSSPAASPAAKSSGYRASGQYALQGAEEMRKEMTAPARITAYARFLLPLIIRADTTGSLEAIVGEVGKMGDEYSGVAIIHSGIGNISENDVKAVRSTHGVRPVLVGFNVGIDAPAEFTARTHSISVEMFNIIYKLTERIAELLATSKPKRVVEEIAGRARVLKTFSSNKETHVVGGAVIEGVVEKGAAARILRRKVEVCKAKIINIQTNKQNVGRIESGAEFGAQIDAPIEIAPDDIIEILRTVTV